MTGMAIGSLIATAVAGTVSAYSTYRTGRIQEQQHKAEAKQYEYQAKLNEERAAIEQAKGEQEKARRSRQLAADIGSMYANFAGNGLLVDGGKKDTVGDVLKTTVREGQADITTIKDNTAMNVWTYQANAASQRASAANARTAAKNAKRGGNIGAFGALHGTGGQLFSSAFGFKQGGAFGGAS